MGRKLYSWIDLVSCVILTAILETPRHMAFLKEVQHINPIAILSEIVL
jgi:hypothetical protein